MLMPGWPKMNQVVSQQDHGVGIRIWVRFLVEQLLPGMLQCRLVLLKCAAVPSLFRRLPEPGHLVSTFLAERYCPARIIICTVLVYLVNEGFKESHCSEHRSYSMR